MGRKQEEEGEKSPRGSEGVPAGGFGPQGKPGTRALAAAWSHQIPKVSQSALYYYYYYY